MLTLDDTPAPHLIRGYDAGEIRLAGQSIRTSCIISARGVIEPWRPDSIAALTLEDLEPVFSLGVSIVLLGSTSRGELPAPRLRAEFGARRVGLEVMELGAACRTFNVLVQEERNVAAALLLAARPAPR